MYVCVQTMSRLYIVCLDSKADYNYTWCYIIIDFYSAWTLGISFIRWRYLTSVSSKDSKCLDTVNYDALWSLDDITGIRIL